jgi:hypothetical protein
LWGRLSRDGLVLSTQFDPRNNVPRIGRVLMARGRDAADAALTTTFGVNQLESFKVWINEVSK